MLDSLRTLQAPPRPVRSSLAQGLSFAAQVSLCAFMLRWLYELAGYHASGPQSASGGVGWAIVSAVLCLMPDLKQSWAMASVRVVANLIGAIVGYVTGATLGLGFTPMVGAMALVALLCQVLRLDQGVRTACVSVIIVMTAHIDLAGGTLASLMAATSRERFAAVVAGCGLSMLVQGLFHWAKYALDPSRRTATPSAGPAHHDG